MSKVYSLGPKTVSLHYSHGSHHEWLSHFSRDERRHLLDEDKYARTSVAAIFATAMISGLALMIALLILAR